jgi:DNA-binding transcriptional MerR regulator
MSASALPSKLFFRIGEVASLVGVEPHVLRYWEREFRSIRPTKSAKGQRVYSRKDVENLLRVRDLLYRDGFTIAGAKKRLQRGVVTEPTTSLLRAAGDPDEADEAESSVVASDRETEREIDTEELGEGADEDDEELALAEPASGPRSQSTQSTQSMQSAQSAESTQSARSHHEVRAKLAALRVEVESFLVELESSERP